MNLRQIQAFRAVMITGSATAAAKMMSVTQPAVSRLIADLEYRSGLTLFDRTPNRLTPTVEAQLLYGEVDRAFIGLDDIQQTAKAIANKQQGSLRIAAMPICVDSFLPSLIAEFLKSHPKVSIELETASANQALELVRSRRLDLALVTLERGEQADLHIQQFCQQQAVCVLPAGHRLCDHADVAAGDLEDETFISLSRDSPFRLQMDELFVREGIKRFLAVETRTQQTIYELVKRGAGVAILDPFITDAEDRTVVIKPFRPEISWTYSAVTPRLPSPSLISQSFIELLISHFSQAFTPLDKTDIDKRE